MKNKLLRVLTTALVVTLVGSTVTPVSAAALDAEAVDEYNFEDSDADDSSDFTDDNQNMDFNNEDIEALFADWDIDLMTPPAENNEEEQAASTDDVLIADVLTSQEAKSAIQELEALEVINSYTEDIDDEMAAEIIDYEDVTSNSLARFTSRIESNYSYRIYRKSDNATMVQFILRGVFSYNGSTSSCISAKVDVIRNSSNYTILSNSTSRTGNYVKGNCSARNKTSGKTFRRILKISCSSSGVIRKTYS